MSTKVIDCSALSAIIFGEPGHTALVKRLDGDHLIAPTLLTYEIASVGTVKFRRKQLSWSDVETGFRAFEGWSVELFEIDLKDVAELAMANSLSAYDASYLWLAKKFGVELVTLDRPLEKAFAQIS